jgi:serine/threonine protein kinase
MAEPEASTPRSGTTTPYPGTFVPPTPAELARYFPQLEILELLGQGGMGAVYKARQLKLDRLVAVKVLPPDWGRDPAFAERFAREAKALARLTHPHIVTVHDFGECDGLFYLVMEYVDGANLRHILGGGRLEPGEALAIIPQICDALQYAHEEGIVHRDIKPENILLDSKGRVKIADFGLAKLLNRPRAAFTLTGSQQVMGTLDYMAPEQRTRPQEVDHRADIYSLGVVFYEMLTGELPLGRFAPLSRKAGVDARLDDVVLRALEREPERRFQRISDVKDELEAIRKTPPPATAVGDDLKLASTAAASIRGRVHGPATGLFFAGLLTVLVGLALVGYSGWTLARVSSAPKQPETRSEGMMKITITPKPESAPSTGLHWLLLVEQLAASGLGGFLILGAVSMRKLEALGLTRTAAMLGLVPYSPAWLLSFPTGLRALSVLRRPEVASSFDQLPWDESEDLLRGPWLGTLAAWGMIVSILGACTAFLPWADMVTFGLRQVVVGCDSWQGIVTGSAFAVAFVLLLLFDRFKPQPLVRSLTMLAAGAAGIALPSVTLWQIGHPHMERSFSGDVFLKDFAESFLNMFLDQVSVTPSFGPYVAIALGAVLFVLGGVQLLRPSRTAPTAPTTENPAPPVVVS